MKHFHKCVVQGKVAGSGKRQMKEAIVQSRGILENRTWVQVKSCIKNLIVKIQKEKDRK